MKILLTLLVILISLNIERKSNLKAKGDDYIIPAAPKKKRGPMKCSECPCGKGRPEGTGRGDGSV